MKFGFPVLEPLLETSGDGGSGGGSLGGDAGAASGGGSGDMSGGAPPPHIDLSNDSYVRVPGSDKPVKFSDYIGGYVSKADFTRAQQRAAAELEGMKRAAAQQEAQFRAAASQIMSRIGGQGGNGAAADPNSLPAVLAQLESASYVDGKTAANLVRQLVNTSVMPLANAIKQRDQALALMFHRLQAVDSTVGSLKNRTSEGDYHGKLAAARSSLGLPDDPAIGELLQDVYLSHEGPDLDTEFPNLVKQRIDGLRNLFRALDKKEAEAAKQRRLGIPGKGGAATTGRPLRRGFQTAQQIADELWPAIGGSET